jgi:hypothetical protein
VYVRGEGKLYERKLDAVEIDWDKFRSHLESKTDLVADKAHWLKLQ